MLESEVAVDRMGAIPLGEKGFFDSPFADQAGVLRPIQDENRMAGWHSGWMPSGEDGDIDVICSGIRLRLQHEQLDSVIGRKRPFEEKISRGNQGNLNQARCGQNSERAIIKWKWVLEIRKHLDLTTQCRILL